MSRNVALETGDHPDVMVVETAAGEWGLATAVFDPERRYRYELSRIWEPEGRRLAWVLLNPSTADALTVDPTLRRVLGYTRDWGFGGAVIVNLFAFRATDPGDLIEVADPIGSNNDVAIEKAVESADGVIVGWGNHGIIRNWARSVLSFLAGGGRAPLALGVTKSGQPLHPLYVPGSRRARPWAEFAGPRAGQWSRRLG